MTFKIPLLLVICTTMLCSENVATAKKRTGSMYKEYKHGHEMMHLSLAAWLAKPVLAGKYNMDARKALKHVKKMKMLIYDGDGPVGSLQENMAQNFNARNFKDLMTINDGGDKVEFKIRQDDKYIRELAMVVKDDSSLVVIFFDGKISLSDAKKFALNYK